MRRESRATQSPRFSIFTPPLKLSTEIRASGHSRQAVQAEYLAEGGAYAAVAYVDMLKANGSLVQYLRTGVAANTASSSSEATVDRETNLLRIEMNSGHAGADLRKSCVDQTVDEISFLWSETK